MAVTLSQSKTPKTRARSTTVALKILMAVTGLFFVFFIVFHMYGNLKAFFGAAAFNGYAEHLREMFMPILPYGGLLWILRVMLVVSLLVHAGSAIHLWLKSKKARGTSYVRKDAIATTYAVRTMRWGGIIILAFVIFHLMHFTFLNIQIGGNYLAMSPYERLIASFTEWWVVLIYFVPVLMLGMHIQHGVWSALATLGANKQRRQFAINAAATAVGALVVVGFMATPVAILLKLIH